VTMNEDFLHYLWKHRQFDPSNLKTEQGEELDIIHTGFHNENAGPDFLDARVRINGTLWAGNVEIHIVSSDWHKHGHQNDPAYDNVVLHVVYNQDKEVEAPKGSIISSLVLKDRIDYQSYRKYKAWVAEGKFIPCDKIVNQVPQLIKTSAVHAAAVERLSVKSEISRDHLFQTKGDMEGAFYRLFLRALGMKVNALPFEQLARITPYELIRKVSPSRIQLESLLLGQAGFLAEAKTDNPHVSQLKSEYDFLKKKHRLNPMPISAWKLFRLRPQNFPQVRLAQLAIFYHQHSSVARAISEMESPEVLYDFFLVKIEDGFWLNHYTLDSESPARKKSFGGDFLKHLVINAVVPFVFSLADYNRDESHRERAIKLLESLPSERNSIIRSFEKLDFTLESSFDSQGIIQLKSSFCDRKKCLRCKVGIHLMKHYAEVG
jgi:hypothetical protein